MSTTPGPGHNNPPPTIDEKLTRANELIKTANVWITGTPEVKDEETAKALQDFLEMIQRGWKALDDQRLEENRAHTKAQKEKYESPLSQLVTAKSTLTKRRTAYLDKKQEELDAKRRAAEAEAERIRKEAEEAQAKAAVEATKAGGDPLGAQRRAEEAAAAAEAALAKAEAVPVRATVRGNYGTRSRGVLETWRAKVTDLREAYAHYGKHPDVREAMKEAIERVASAEAKVAQDPLSAPKGVEFYVTRN